MSDEPKCPFAAGDAVSFQGRKYTVRNVFPVCDGFSAVISPEGEMTTAFSVHARELTAYASAATAAKSK